MLKKVLEIIAVLAIFAFVMYAGHNKGYWEGYLAKTQEVTRDNNLATAFSQYYNEHFGGPIQCGAIGDCGLTSDPVVSRYVELQQAFIGKDVFSPYYASPAQIAEAKEAGEKVRKNFR